MSDLGSMQKAIQNIGYSFWDRFFTQISINCFVSSSVELYRQLLNIMSIMADMKKIYNDLIIINLYWQWNLKTSKLKLFWVVLELFFGFFGFFKLWYPKLLTTYPNFSPVNHKEHWNIPKIPRLFFQKWWFFLVFREKPCKVGRNSKLQLEGMTEIKY